MKTEIIKAKLIAALTDYDRRQSAKPCYNRWALPQYFQRVDSICEDIDRGADLRSAIIAGFTGRLADKCLRAVGAEITTRDEQTGGLWHYEPKTVA